MFGKLPSSCCYHGNKCFPVEILKKINIALNNSFIAILQ